MAKTYLIPKLNDGYESAEYAHADFLKLTLSDADADAGLIPSIGLSFDQQLGAFTVLG